MNFIRYHWFGLLVSVIVALFLCQFLLVLIAPHQDEQKRGFVPCTEEMSEELHRCRSRNLCVLDAVVDNTFCNTGVIVEGFRLWVAGKQDSPWANYLFEPELNRPSAEDDVDAEASLDEYYRDVPDINAEMDELQKLNQQLENDDNE